MIDKLILAAKRILNYQYKNLYMGVQSCSSCGAQQTVDWDDGGQYVYKQEECSRSCPWRMLAESVNEVEKEGE